MADEQELGYYPSDERAEPPISFYSTFRDLHRETSDSIGADGQVDEQREYRFDVEFPDRRYAFQGYPDENRVFVGQYLGDSGVIWFDELRYDLLHHGWRAAEESAWDFARNLIDKRSLTYEASRQKAKREKQSGGKESPTSVEPTTQPLRNLAPERPQRPQKGPRQGRVVRAARTLYQGYRQARALLSHVPGPRKVLGLPLRYLRARRQAP